MKYQHELSSKTLVFLCLKREGTPLLTISSGFIILLTGKGGFITCAY